MLICLPRDTLRTVHQASLQASLRTRPSIMQADIVPRSYKWAMTPRSIGRAASFISPAFHPSSNLSCVLLGDFLRGHSSAGRIVVISRDMTRPRCWLD
ncbi:hypothetical protein CDAR_63951 [Caerostris darwini]|uniref:Uncharacterized protein n=1 Tax=Caerostris darwini TaxID=1538125 RepID=A0AAV4PM45_9ARAC|nr:hypothetical protein CDAR_63951 [Caerostris darwini]